MCVCRCTLVWLTGTCSKCWYVLICKCLYVTFRSYVTEAVQERKGANTKRKTVGTREERGII